MVFSVLWRLILGWALIGVGVNISLDPMPDEFSFGHWISWILFNGISLLLYILLNGLGIYWCFKAVHLGMKYLRNGDELYILPRFVSWRFTAMCISMIMMGLAVLIYSITGLGLSPVLSGLVMAFYVAKQIQRHRKMRRRASFYKPKEIDATSQRQDKV